MAKVPKIKYCRSIIVLIPLVILTFACSTPRIATAQRKGAGIDTARYENLLIEAKKQQILENTQKSIELFEEILRFAPSDPVVNYELARIHHADGRNSKALEYSSKAASVDQANKWIHILSAEILMDLSRFSDAANEMSIAIKLDESDPDLYIMHASALTYAGKHKDAIKVYDRLETRFGINEDVSFEKHRLYLQIRDVDGATLELKKLIESAPNEPKYYGVLAEFYVRLGEKEKAAEYFNKVLEIDPGNPQVRVSLADYYREQGDDKRAFSELMTAFRSPRLDIDSKVSILLTYYSITENSSRYIKEAYQLLDTLIVIHPLEAKAWSIYGDFLLRDNKNQAALDMFNRVLELDSTRYPVWEQVLTLYSATDNADALISEGSRAVTIFPEQPLPYLFQSIGLLKKDRNGEAIKLLERGLFFVTDDKLRIQFLINIAQANYNLGKKQKTYEQFDRILTTDPDNVIVLNNYAYFLSLDGERLEKASEMASKAKEKEPQNPTYLDTYAWVLFKQKNYASALQWSEKAISTGGDNDPVVMEHHGDILYHLGRVVEARKWWALALLKDATNATLQNKINTGEYHE